MKTIEVHNLSKKYSSWKKKPGLLGALAGLVWRETILVPAVRGVSFDVEAGEFIGFIGPNGAGKTTTLKMLSGILHPTSGTAKVLGHVPWHRERKFQEQFALVMGQKNQLWWDLPARDSFLLNKEIYGIGAAAFSKRVKELSELMRVDALLDLPVKKLSLGERMKCELINALLHRPRVLFLDEPTIGLDVVSQKIIRDFLRDWNREEGTTVILTSHAMQDVEELCKRVLVIDRGELQFDGELAELVRQVADHKEIMVTFEKPVLRVDLEKIGTVAKFTPVLATLHIPRESVRDVAKSLLETLPVADLNINEIAIEEVVRKIFEKR